MNQDFEDFMVANMHENSDPASGCVGCLPVILVVALLLVATFLFFH